MKTRLRRTFVLAAAILFSTALVEVRQPAAEQRRIVAVADFDYSDTSGEVKDQTTDHIKRIAMLDADVTTLLSKNPRFEARRLRCRQTVCSASELGPTRIIEDAKADTARYLVYGGVHKSSTLVEWLKVEMVDLQTETLLASTLITFRGDTDEAYRRAARFVADDLSQKVEAAK